MKSRWFGALAPTILSAQGSSQTPPCDAYPGLPCPSADQQIGPGVISLTAPTTLRYRSLRIADGTVIETNGHALTLTVDRNLVVDGSATIRSFDPTKALDPAPPPPRPGPDGATFDPGPNTEGAPDAGDGANGGDGQPGSTGLTGLEGRNAAAIILRVGGGARGKLTIVNDGGTGGIGGFGGSGGNGGNGQQGGRGKPAFIGCEKGGGSGGKGGNAGVGGAGGPGGSGGRGGTIDIRISDTSDALLVRARAFSGSAGPTGQPGAAGTPGGPGFGGRGSRGCRGEETNRRGAQGAQAGVATPVPIPQVAPTEASVTIVGAKRQ